MNRYHITLCWSEGDHGWIADVPDPKSGSAIGGTPEEALSEVQQAMAAWLQVAADESLPIPEPRHRRRRLTPPQDGRSPDSNVPFFATAHRYHSLVRA